MQEITVTYELLKNYIGELPLGLFLFDANKRLVSWNGFAASFLEIHDEDLKKSYLGFADKQIIEILETEQITEKDIIGLSKPLKAKKIITNDKNTILIITETVQEAIGEMSHELRRPITNIKTLTESLLLGAKNEPEIAQKFLEQINAEADRLGRLVNQLLNISKIRSGRLSQEKKKINLKTKADEAIKLLQSIADKNKTQLINEVEEGYQILADPEQIDHVIQNLIENAIRYSPENSKVSVRTGPAPGSFEIVDTGIGIKESDIPKIFERFYRVDRTRVKGSSGLGLSIVKNVVDIHSGKIEVKSKPGSGSSFIIYLPIS